MSAAHAVLSDRVLRTQYDVECRETSRSRDKPKACPTGQQPMGWMRVLRKGRWSWLPVYVNRGNEIEVVRDPIEKAKVTLLSRVGVESRWGGLHGPHARKFLPLDFGEWDMRSGLEEVPNPPIPSTPATSHTPSPHLPDQPDKSWQQSFPILPKRNRVPPLSTPSFFPSFASMPPFTPVPPPNPWNQCIHCCGYDPQELSSQDPSPLPRKVLVCLNCEALHKILWSTPFHRTTAQCVH